MTRHADDPALHHRQIDVGGASLHVIESGARDKPAVLFLHGWPQSGAAFEPLMTALCAQARVVAMDLPGIGGSSPAAPGGEKRAIAACVQGVIR